jgi:Flp pilus assembly protein TadD
MMESAMKFHESTRSFLEAGDFDEALEHAGRGLELYPDDGRLWEMRGIALGCRRETDEAMRSLETASTLVPLSAVGQMALAACYLRTQNRESAKCIYEYLATMDDLSTEILAELATGLDYVGRTELALDVCQALVCRVPNCDMAWFMMAGHMTKLDRPAEQIMAAMRRAFELRPGHALYRVDLALLLARCGRRKEAYQLVTAVELPELLDVRCPPRLAGLITMFRTMNDERRASVCQLRITQLMERRRAKPS